MKKFISILLIALSLLVVTGCGNLKRMEARITGYSEIIIDGVVYLQFPSGVTPKYNSDGKIVTIK